MIRKPRETTEGTQEPENTAKLATNPNNRRGAHFVPLTIPFFGITWTKICLNQNQQPPNFFILMVDMPSPKCSNN
jgi:hypothetical protein